MSSHYPDSFYTSPPGGSERSVHITLLDDYQFRLPQDVVRTVLNTERFPVVIDAGRCGHLAVYNEEQIYRFRTGKVAVRGERLVDGREFDLILTKPGVVRRVGATLVGRSAQYWADLFMKQQ